ncbi:MAG TPA: beta-ketoacyl synthase N-terminal-like domain-containing protein, partial [Kofleriaceae bacterium]|nr:beta-ketoacyl synthase N-terminal-like domain-containing protein [Kofleriaceae bacterium]
MSVHSETTCHNHRLSNRESGGEAMSEVVVTGIGPVLANCADRHTMWNHLRDGASQLTFEVAPGGDGERWPVGRVHGFAAERWLNRFPHAYYERYHREQQLYLASLMIAIDDAGLDLATVPGERLAIFDGTSRGNFDYWYQRIRSEEAARASEIYTRRELLTGTPGQAANLAASLLGVRGPVYTFNVTCCSGAAAIGQACRELERGEVEVAFASGHDSSLQAPLYRMYRDAGLLSQEQADPRRAIRPYTGQSRNAFGEGAITLVLETREHAARCGATPLARITGWRLGNNGSHPLHVDAEGRRATTLIAQVLADAEVERDRIGFVVGHGNGVEQSDRSEVAYMQSVFADRAADVPLLSVKPIYGHLFGASSALSVAAAILMLHHGWLVPTLNVDPARTTPGVEHLASGGRPSAAS